MQLIGRASGLLSQPVYWLLFLIWSFGHISLNTNTVSMLFVYILVVSMWSRRRQRCFSLATPCLVSLRVFRRSLVALRISCNICSDCYNLAVVLSIVLCMCRRQCSRCRVLLSGIPYPFLARFVGSIRFAWAH